MRFSLRPGTIAVVVMGCLGLAAAAGLGQRGLADGADAWFGDETTGSIARAPALPASPAPPRPRRRGPRKPPGDVHFPPRPARGGLLCGRLRRPPPVVGAAPPPSPPSGVFPPATPRPRRCSRRGLFLQREKAA